MKYLPVFVHIQDKPCWVVGGGDVAARKASLLIEAGAKVSVIAPTIKTEMQGFVDKGKVKLYLSRFDEEIARDLDKPSLVISATDDESVNQDVYDYCKAQDIWINVADNTPLCKFILPAIVKRPPMIMAISTGGASPILARMMKARLEKALPVGLGQLTQALSKMRDVVKTKILDVETRKSFWEWVLNDAFIDAAIKDNDEIKTSQKISQKLNQYQDKKPNGEVYLIGAGPGNPMYLTLQAHQLIKQADVLVYDRLVSEEVLELARREATRIYVGKKANDHPVSQEKINQILLDYAKQGLKVARLKGGDPYVFGRGAEEVAVLKMSGIDYIVVPGVTAATGCSLAADIPLTHRDYAQSVSIVTGHQKEGGQKIDYARLAHSDNTMVFYMGIKNVYEIEQELLAHGLCPTTMSALIERGTTPKQRVFTCRLDELSSTVETYQISPPALIVIGDVVNVREQLHG